MKKIIILFVALTFSFAITNVYAYDFSAIAPSGQTLYYQIRSYNEVRLINPNSSHYDITEYSMQTGDLVIPSSVIYNGATYSVISIENYAFYNCSALTSITIPSSVTSIGRYAFYKCTALTSVSIPSSVTLIEPYAFYNCTALTSVTIPTSVTSIGSLAFAYCSALTSVTIPNTVTYIGGAAFSYCTALTSVSIPSSVTSIGERPFGYCSALTDINVAPSNTAYSSLDGVLYNSNKSELIQCPPGKTSVIIPNATTTIRKDAFSNCRSLISVTITNSVTSIGKYAFENCSALTSITIPNSVSLIEINAFNGCSALTEINVDSLNTTYSSQDGILYNNNKTELKRCPTGKTSVTIPSSVTSIGDYAFFGCLALESVIIPSSVTSIGESVFSGCITLPSITIPNSVITIGSYAFGLVNNIIYYGYATGSPWGAKTINGYFEDSFVFTDNTKTVLTGYYGTLTDIIIPSSVTSIESFAFSKSALTSVSIPNSVTSIGSYAFSQCSTLTSVTIPSSVTSIGNDAFDYCTALTSVSIPSSVTSIEDNTFNHCYALTSVTIPSSVTSIGSNNFSYCSALTSVTIPSSVTSIGNYTFHNCLALDSVFLQPSTPPTIGVSAFGPIKVNRRFYIPCGTTESYSHSWVSNNDYSEIWTSYNINVGVNDSLMGSSDYTLCENRISINASSNYGYHFTQWSDGDTNNSRTITLTQDTSLIAMFAPNQYAVTGSPNNILYGIVTGSDTVDYLDTVTLTATPNYGYQFNYWYRSGYYEYIQANPLSVIANDNITYTAFFTRTVYSVSTDAENGSIIVSGTRQYQTQVSLSAISNYGYHFTQWSDVNTDNPRSFNITQDTSFTALFERNEYTLTFKSSDTTMGVVSIASVSGLYLDTTTFITATALSNYHFTHWNDGNTDNPRRFVLDSNIIYIASFAIDTHTVILQADNIAHGAVQGGGNFAYGTAISISATPYSGYRFTHWSNGSIYNPYMFAVLEDKTLTAVFVADGEPWQDTVVTYDTTYITMHDTTFINVYVHDTTIVDNYIHDTTYLWQYDTTYIDNYIHDTTIVVNWIYDTTYLWQYDTTYIDNYIHDTTIVDNWIYDTTIVVDTLWLTQYDTVWLTLYDTVWLHDTVIVHDTIYITQEGIGDVAESSIKLYQSNGQIVVEGAAGKAVYMYDINGRLLMRRTENEERRTFDVPVSGAYLIKVGELPARKIVVIR